MKKILCVIPSRIHSTRLARKPLLPIKGKPMVQWVYENASLSPLIAKVVVATDSKEIADVILNIGGHVEMTDPDIKTGSDRVAVVAEKFPDMDIVINLQGDEPFITPTMLEELVSPYLVDDLPEMTTLARPLDLKYHVDPSIVKVITDLAGNAIYFSRSPIPYFRTSTHVPLYHHIGLYAFRRDFLHRYLKLSQTPLEKAEALEQLRVLEHGYKIKVCITQHKTLEINTQEEYERAHLFAETVL